MYLSEVINIHLISCCSHALKLQPQLWLRILYVCVCSRFKSLSLLARCSYTGSYSIVTVQLCP